MNTKVFKVNSTRMFINVLLFIVIILFISKIDFLLSIILFVFIGGTIIWRELVNQPFEIEINEYERNIVVVTKTLFILNNTTTYSLDSLSFSYKEEIAGRFSKSKKMRLFLGEKQLILNQLYGGWNEEVLDEIEVLLMKNNIRQISE